MGTTAREDRKRASRVTTRRPVAKMDFNVLKFSPRFRVFFVWGLNREFTGLALHVLNCPGVNGFQAIRLVIGVLLAKVKKGADVA